MGYESKRGAIPVEDGGYRDKIGAAPPPVPPQCPPPSGLPWEGYYYSAYGIATKHGFSGTEEEWLESLHGKDGKDGQLYDKHTGDPIAVWIGTLAEYNAISPEPYVLYAIKEGSV